MAGENDDDIIISQEIIDNSGGSNGLKPLDESVDIIKQSENQNKK